jgi:membrane protease subunit HflC
MRILLCLVLFIAVPILALMSIFTVDPSEFVYVTQFGEPVAVYDGDKDGDAGLHWRWPWPVQSVLRLDRRLQYFDLPGAEFSTFDPKGNTVDKMLVVEAYACWRILGKDEDPEAVDRFIRRLGTPEQARLIVGQLVNSALGARIGQMKMDELISTALTEDKATRKIDITMAKLREAIRDQLRPQMREVYGVELVDIGLRRFNHPLQARDAILARIKSERKRMADSYRNQGETEAKNIVTEAKRAVSDMLADADHKAKVVRGEAQTQADRIRTQAHAKDPDFYVFLKKLDKMQSILGDNRTLLLLSTHRPIFDLLFQPPRPTAATMPVPEAPANGPEKNGPMPKKQPE